MLDSPPVHTDTKASPDHTIAEGLNHTVVPEGSTEIYAPVLNKVDHANSFAYFLLMH